jgi:predicted methyltransferase
MKSIVAFSILAAWLVGCASSQTTTGGGPVTLESVIQSDQRPAAERARDRYRHPLQTLQFFGIRDDMNVVEVSPGEGWYTDILAPYLKAHGHLTLADGNPSSPKPARRESAIRFREKITGNPERYGHPDITVLDPPAELRIAPPGSADLVVTFRNMHNWMGAGAAPAVFKAMYDALKPGGILGFTEHRAKPGKQDPKAVSGYVTEEYAVKVAESVGFRLLARSEINANPNDTKDYPEGVWTLPPTLRLKDKDRARYVAIGESDRMTLKFQKPQ